MLSAALQRLRSERAIALPVAVSMLFITMALTGAAATLALSDSNQSSRDRNEKRALEAADAGIQVALFRINNGSVTFNTPARCTTIGSDGRLVTQAFSADYWCPSYADQLQTEQMDEGVSFRFDWSSPTWPSVSPTWVGDLYAKKITVVSTGIAGNVRRRLRATLIGPVGSSPLGCYTVIAQDRISLYNDSRIDHNGQSNTCGVRSDSNPASLVNDGNDAAHSAVLCDKVDSNVTSGSAVTFTPPADRQCNDPPDYWASQNRINVGNGPLLPVDQGNAATVNDNGAQTCFTGMYGGACVYDPVKRTLKLYGDAVVGLGGSVYSFCDIQTIPSWDDPFPNEGGSIITSATKDHPVHIYIDSPENCHGYAPGGWAPSDRTYRVSIGNLCSPYGYPSAVWLYVVGSKDAAYNTTLQLVRGSDTLVTGSRSCMVVYAPNTAVETRGVGQSFSYGNPTVGTIQGAVVGKSVSLYGNLHGPSLFDYRISDRILADDDTVNMAATVTPIFYRQPGTASWRECTPEQTGPAPNWGCP